MSAQVTEKHIDLVRCVLDAEWWGSNVEKRFAQIIADSEEKATDQVRDEVKRLTAACDKFSNAEITQGDLKSRAERAEAELHALRLICGTTDADRFSTWVDRANARAEKAEAEPATERAKARMLHSALQNLADEQNGAPLERRREEWQEAMDEAIAALAATEEKL